MTSTQFTLDGVLVIIKSNVFLSWLAPLLAGLGLSHQVVPKLVVNSVVTAVVFQDYICSVP